MREYHVERMFRDIKLGTIGGGTSEVQRSIISSGFPGFEKFTRELAGFQLEIGGLWDKLGYSEWTGYLLEGLKEVSESPARKQNQAMEFAFADLLVCISVMDSFLSQVDRDTNWYERDSKIRDSVLLLSYLTERYFPSLRKLSGVSRSIRLFLEKSLEDGNRFDEVESCFGFLQEQNRRH